MFLAIINDTFTEVKAEIAAKKLAYDVGDYIKRGYNNVLGKVGQRDKVCCYSVASCPICTPIIRRLVNLWFLV